MAYNLFIKVLDDKDKKTYLCRPEKRAKICYWFLVQDPGSWIGSSAVENRYDEGVTDFQGPDEQSDIGMGNKILDR
jgi:hypothetical protein